MGGAQFRPGTKRVRQHRRNNAAGARAARQPLQDIRPSTDTNKELITRLTWPAGTHDLGATTSGINCMLVVLKQIYSYVGDLPRFWNKDSPVARQNESRNAFMAYAWLDLSRAEQQDLETLVQEYWGHSLAGMDQRYLTFEAICNSVIMRETLWTQDDFRPVKPILWQPVGTDSWLRSDDPETPDFVLSLESSSSLGSPTCPKEAAFELSPGATVDTLINRRFGTCAMNDVYIQIQPSGSRFFFATFNVQNVNEGACVSFEDISSFTLRLEISESHRGEQYSGRQRLRYDLITAVFQRNQIADVDSVRVYDGQGIHISGAAPGSTYSWPSTAVSQMRNGDSFFALYLHVPRTLAAMPRAQEMGKGGGAIRAALTANMARYRIDMGE